MAGGKGAPAKAKPTYRVVAFFAGRPGSQMEYHNGKREAIRVLKRLLVQAPFGSTGAVKMIRAGEETLIYQASVMHRRSGATFVKAEEL